MITLSFLNSCYELIFSQKQRELEKSVYEDLLYFLNFAEKKVLQGDVGIIMKHEFNLLKKICELKVKDGSLSEILASIAVSEKYKQLNEYVQLRASMNLSEQEQAGRIKTIQKLVAFCKLNNTFKRFAEYKDIVMAGNFETIDDVINEWRDMVKIASSDVANYELKTRTDLVSSLNTRDDSINSLIHEIQKKYSKDNVVPSGIPELDIEFLNGGFQPSRLHMFAGTSGIGKSALLINCAMRAAMISPYDLFSFTRSGGSDEFTERVFLYITMENYVYETWTRLYCSLFQKTKEEMLAEIYHQPAPAKNIKKAIDELMAPYNSSIQIDYFPANSISPATISSLINKYNRNPERRSVKAVYIDYLDLLLPDVKKEFYRLDLGEITSSLKAISATFEIPIITATQLNREAYRQGKNKELGMEMISESMQKLFIADFSAMMFWEDRTDKNAEEAPSDLLKKVVLKIDKNRDGKTGKTHIYFDYPRSRFMTKDEYVKEYEKLLDI
jgi:replicative DNA helicase